MMKGGLVCDTTWKRFLSNLLQLYYVLQDPAGALQWGSPSSQPLPQSLFKDQGPWLMERRRKTMFW